MSEITKYLSYEGLQKYHSKLKQYFSNTSLVAGRVGLATYASKLETPRKIDFIGAITGDGTFDGSKDITISTQVHLEGSYDIGITGNASTATNFKNNKPINLSGAVTGYATGGADATGWNLVTSLTTGSVTNEKLAGNITNSKLQNSTITIGSTQIELGGTANVLNVDITGDLTGNATSADSATSDSAGNVIVTTYATKAELDQISSAVRFVGEVQTLNDLPNDASNGDIYNVLLPNPTTYIWSDNDNNWSVFGTAYGPATSDVYGLVKVGNNITNTSGKLSLSRLNIDNALGYQAISGVSVNGVAQSISNRVVDITIPSDYVTQQDIDNSINYTSVTNALGFDPIENVSVNGVDLSKVNHRVNVDLSDYATEDWTSQQINAKVSSLYKFKGSINSYGDLLHITGQVTGDTYNVINGNDPETQEPDWPAFNSGTNFAWDGDEWDSLGGSLDFSNYYKKAEVDDLLDTKAAVSHNHNDLYYSKAQVDAMFSDLRTWVTQQIAEAGHVNETQVRNIVNSIIASEKQSGNLDDVRVFADYDHFPGNTNNPYETPVEDVEYVDKSTGLEYHWSVVGGVGSYKPINAIATDSDIDNMFN